MNEHPPLSNPLDHPPDVIAPDGSEIRLLESADEDSSMVHASLKPGQVTQAVQHRTVVESWTCVGGHGELWRSSGGSESVIELRPGVRCEIPLGTKFQFRAPGDSDSLLEIVITTTPPWPGEHEAVKCNGRWEPSL